MTPADVFTSRMPASFADRLTVGAFWEGWVATCLTKHGLHVLCHPAVVGGERNHSISHDLDVFAHDPNFSGTFASESCLRRKAFGGDEEGWSAEAASQRVSPNEPIQLEVKSSKHSFTGPDDHPESTVMVCAQDSWLNKWPGKETVQRNFILVSRVTGRMAWIPTGTKVQMNHPVHDRNRNYSYKCVVVGKEQLRTFKGFVNYVKNHNKET